LREHHSKADGELDAASLLRLYSGHGYPTRDMNAQFGLRWTREGMSTAFQKRWNAARDDPVGSILEVPKALKQYRADFM